ncbi:aminopeptidase [Erysipelothrix urinaevulpis]|uniref:aminopeptidase n=1 Tax=Erysipelothrix urinaevulpis TaxID=2683717 RepID=UPI00135AAA6E|nr:aminopeptidase [Erysipelothrix urinaevulpis]
MNELDKKYANLLVSVGLNVQEGQTVLINAAPEHYEFVTLITEQAYGKKAKQVIVKFTSEAITRLDYLNQDVGTLTDVKQWEIDESLWQIEQDLCLLALRSPNPGLMDDVDSSKVTEKMQAYGKAMTKRRDYTMSSKGQWLVAAYPSVSWAQAVFPKLDDEEAYDKLYQAILKASRVSEDNDPIKEWENHNAMLKGQNDKLNEYDFESLTFTNAMGTNITVGLVKGHQWGGGAKPALNGVNFNANIPTEESFTTPDRMNVNGIVYNSIALNNNGRLIDKFWLKFENGYVVDYDAEIGKEALTKLLQTDDNSKRIGEIALVSYDSPISNMGILFYNTLFDENASCHIALGQGYPLIEKGGLMSSEELLERGINQSIIHVDFMFGTQDMKIVGRKFDGTMITIMENGNLTLV